MDAHLTAAIEVHLQESYGDDYYLSTVSVDLSDRMVRFAKEAAADLGTIALDDDLSGTWHWSWGGQVYGDGLTLDDAATGIYDQAVDYTIRTWMAGSLPR